VRAGLKRRFLMSMSNRRLGWLWWYDKSGHLSRGKTERRDWKVKLRLLERLSKALEREWGLEIREGLQNRRLSMIDTQQYCS